MAKVRRCDRCDRRLRGAALGWGVQLDFGADQLASTGDVLCPDCQTDAEQSARENNDRDYDYVWRGDRVSLWPKAISN